MLQLKNQYKETIKVLRKIKQAIESDDELELYLLKDEFIDIASDLTTEMRKVSENVSK